MDKNECKNVVELLSVTWNQSLDNASLTIRMKGYWEYINDLEYEAVRDTIKEMGISGKKWLPRPGELRTIVLAKVSGEELPPEPEEAWTVLQAIGQKIYSGTYDYSKPHAVLSETIKRLGTNATALTTNADRAMFISLYEKTREAWILERYGHGTH